MSAILDADYEFVTGAAANSYWSRVSSPAAVIDAKFKVVRQRKSISPEAVLASVGMFIGFGFGGLIPFIAHHLAH